MRLNAIRVCTGASTRPLHPRRQWRQGRKNVPRSHLTFAPKASSASRPLGDHALNQKTAAEPSQPSPGNTEWLEDMYNNRVRVPAHPQHFAHWAQASAEARAQGPCVLDVAYGSGINETLDVFPASRPAAHPGAPVLVFIHGGYWRSLDKADHSFIAPAFTAKGACVVLLNYALCPAVTVTDISLQMVHALAWVWRHIASYGGDPARITVAGHSAGGHLAALLLTAPWPDVGADLPADLVKKALSISGLFELDCMRQTPSMQASLRLTPEEVVKLSPARLPAPAAGSLVTVVGGDESAEFIRHNGLMQAAWGLQRVPLAEVLPGLNHFSAVEALTEPGHRLHALVVAMVMNE